MLPRLRCAALLALTAAAVPDAHAQTGETAAFVTRLGADTVAVERFTLHRDGSIASTVVVRVPTTTVTTARLTVDARGTATYTAETRTPGGAVVRRESAQRDGDSLRVTSTQADGTTRTRAMAAAPGVVPFIEMTHWPVETALRRAAVADPSSAPVPQPMFTDRGLVRFTLARVRPDSAVLTHPTRGPMGIATDGEGRLLRLDAGATTRKLTVTRVGAGTADLDALARRFAARDAAGQAFGTLSGRAQTTFALGGATIGLDYGQPAARGRALFGALVPWGERWRTGADGATHFETDRDLLVGDLRVPAGRYTLSSIPQPDGGLLIVNRQTGQSGTSYDAARDLGRVPMTRVALDAPVERLTLRVVEGAAGGELRIEWGTTAFVVPVRVAD